MQQAHEIRAIRSGLIIPQDVSSGSPDPLGPAARGPWTGWSRARGVRPRGPGPPATGPALQLHPGSSLSSSPTREPRPYRLSTLGMALARSASSAREGFERKSERDRRSRARVRVVITNVRDSTSEPVRTSVGFGDLHRPLRSIIVCGRFVNKQVTSRLKAK